ncbi:hypothetical protein EUX98_g8873 [Antrodiella citrinella]|uniref:Reverse transcriptase domain-containing protein n=1 Tax=Antrodiella citrinella TaxID=2447956 RepID=A0A4S4M227_9APHY|nr:hypothetical protein EUX98_g8873 [Antrodiella citrinella]
MDPVTEEEMAYAIKALSPFKAPGPSGTPNTALQQCLPTLLQPLTVIANASLRLGYHPRLWKTFTTITLRKPGKPDYMIPKAYRPIALEDTMGKVIESVMAQRLATMAEQYNLLPLNHFGGRPGRTTTDAVLYVVQRIKDAWWKHQVTSVLFLDISQAFLLVSHPRLLHNLRKRGVPGAMVNWIASFLTDQCTQLKFDDFTSDVLLASVGIPQGSPLSSILYLFYSADLLEIVDLKDRDQMAGGYIDDTMLAVSSSSVAENITMLEQLVPKALAWSRTHACKFDIAKFQLVHFTRNEKKHTPLPLVLTDHTIQASDTAKYLGIVLDRRLRWHEQSDAAVAKGTATVMAISRLTRPTFDMPHKFIRQLFWSVVLPRMEYGLVVWCEPTRLRDRSNQLKGSVGLAKKLGKVQRIASRLITGAFKTTASDFLDFHANIPPIRLRLNQSLFNSTARLASLPPSHLLAPAIQRCQHRYPRLHRSPLHELFNAFPKIRNLETIDCTPLKTTWIPPFTYRIAPNKDQAEKEVADYADSFCVYSDGSGYKGRIGAAAVAKTKDSQLSVRQLSMGTDKHHTVFKSEVVGTILALDIIESQPRIRAATILLDNQAAIKALAQRRPRPGQYLVNLFHKTCYVRAETLRRGNG